MGKAEVRPSIAQRCYYQISCPQNERSAVILRELASSQTRTNNRFFFNVKYTSFKQFRGGRKVIENKLHDWIPRIDLIEKNIASPLGLNEDDRRLNVKEIASNAGIRFESAQNYY